jgi:hypothetical protein
MTTDWDLVRAMIEAAIDFCEEAEALGLREQDRSATIEAGGQRVSVYDIMTSAWTFPESVRYRIVRERHDKGADLPYVPEAARVLVGMAQACAELIGAKDAAPAEDVIQNMLRWYGQHAAPGLREAIAGRAG